MTKEEFTEFNFNNSEVQDFIEDKNHQTALHGKLVNKKIGATDLGIAKKTANWMIKTQKDNGDFFSIPSSKNETVEKSQWLETIIFVYGLAEFGKAIHEQKYIDSADKFFSFAYRFILEEKIEIPNLKLVLTYYGQLALSLDKKRGCFVLCRTVTRTNKR